VKGNDRRYKQNNGTIGPSRRRGAGGIARGGGSGFVPPQCDLPGPEQHPAIRSREDEAPIAEQIEEIATLPFHRVQHLIKACGLPQHVELQERAIMLALTRLLEGRTPKPGQIWAVQRIVYSLGDTILIAGTGYGKSIVLHALSSLTEFITIQIIPLSKLGANQYEAVNRYPDATACLITAETRKANPGIFREIEQCKYSHILLGAEQAALPEFRRCFTNPRFRERVRLVAIDEAHVLREWATQEFRTDFLLIHELRRLMSREAVFFACSATVCLETERVIRTCGGFRQEGSRVGDLEVIRTSIDRPDISINIQPIERGQQTSCEQLFAFLHKAINPETGELTPQQVPKTLIFLDSKNGILRLAKRMRKWLTLQGFTPQVANQLVSEYTSLTQSHDQNRLYAIFSRPDSPIRIMIATNSFGMGLDIPGVEIVVQWNFLISSSLADLVQRFGRAARRPGEKATAFLFLPHWVFNCLGKDPPSNEQPLSTTRLQSGSGKGRARNRLARDRGPSSLRHMVNASDRDSTPGGSDAESIGSQASVTSNRPQRRPRVDAITCTEYLRLARGSCDTTRSPRQWTQTDLKHRSELDPFWADFINSQCHRAFLLDHFREKLADPSTKRDPAPSSLCCSGCNPSLHVMPVVEGFGILRKAPAAGSKAGIALGLITDWCGHRAREVGGVPDEDVFIPTPPDYFLKAHWRWELARCFTKAKNCAVFEPRTLEDFNKIVPPDKWKFSSSHASAMLLFLRQNVDFVNAEYSRLHPSKPPRGRDNSTGNTQEGTVSVASRRNQLALAAALRRQQEQDRAAQKSTAEAGDIGNQAQVGGMATPVGDVLTASSSTQHISISAPSVVPTTPPRNSGSILGSPPSVSALLRAAESLSHLNQRPRLSPTGEAMPPPVSQVPSSSAGPKSFVRMPVGSTTPESVFNVASLLDSPSAVTDVGSISDHVVDDSPSRTAARSNNRRKETFAEGLLGRTKAATDDGATPTTPIRRGRKRPRPPLTPIDANSGLLSIRGDESAPRSDGRRRRKVTLTERAIQSGLYKV
jgi:helicase-like protein/RAD3-like DEAD/DEAH box helicase